MRPRRNTRWGQPITKQDISQFFSQYASFIISAKDYLKENAPEAVEPSVVPASINQTQNTAVVAPHPREEVKGPSVEVSAPPPSAAAGPPAPVVESQPPVSEPAPPANPDPSAPTTGGT